MKGGDREMKKLISILLVVLLLAVGLALPAAGPADAVVHLTITKSVNSTTADVGDVVEFSIVINKVTTRTLIVQKICDDLWTECEIIDVLWIVPDPITSTYSYTVTEDDVGLFRTCANVTYKPTGPGDLLTVTGCTDLIVGSLLVDIDIRPGSDPNLLYLNRKGMLPVAILGTASFDAMTVDPETVRLQGIKADSYKSKDVDHDGYMDILLYFEDEDIIAVLGEGGIGDEIPLELTGELSDGTPISGEDTVVIAQRGKGKKE
jgi:hypothetical protein